MKLTQMQSGHGPLELILYCNDTNGEEHIPCLEVKEYPGNNTCLDIVDLKCQHHRISLHHIRYSILSDDNPMYSLVRVQTKTKEDGMKMEHNVIQVNLSERFGNFTVKRYDYKTEIPLAMDDLVVVETQYGPALGRVCSFDKPTVKSLKWVIQKVDLEAVEKRAARESALKELKSKVTKRANEVRKHQELEFLASTDLELRSLIAQLQRLESDVI